jgi:predicted CXXCH cytochrome family protein
MTSPRRAAAWLAALALLAAAMPAYAQEPTPAGCLTPDPVLGCAPPSAPPECTECHLDVAAQWGASPHAHAFDAADFQARWTGAAMPGDCLVCHTTGYDPATGGYAAEGVKCAACHTPPPGEHPPAIFSVQGSAEACGACHPITLAEWRLSRHAGEAVDCLDCHDPHSQGARFATSDALCLDCHAEDVAAAEGTPLGHQDNLHLARGLACVDCHTLAVPAAEPASDGLQATGHAFTVNAGACLACHTDTVLAGTPLPGYEQGAAAAISATPGPALTGTPAPTLTPGPVTMDPPAGNRGLAPLLGGSLLGIVLGGGGAWLVFKRR